MSLSLHQVFMLKHFAMGWRFKLDNKKPGSWCTYWSLRRRGLVSAGSMVTELGRKVLAKELALQAKRDEKNEANIQTTKQQAIAISAHAACSRGQGAADHMGSAQGQSADRATSGQHGQEVQAWRREADQAVHARGQEV